MKTYWNETNPKYQEVMKTLENKEVTHLMKEGHQPRGTVSDSKNQKTLLQVLKETFAHPKCKRVLAEHEHTKDIMCLWGNLWTSMDQTIMDQNNAMIREHRFMSIYVHGVIWKGTQM
jgi:hypothetical protein